MLNLRKSPAATILSSLILCVGLLTLAGGCGSKQEKVADKSVTLMSDIADKLDSITTADDVTKYKSDLQALGARMKDLAAEQQALPKPTDDEVKALEAKYKGKMDPITQRITASMQRIGQSAGPQAMMDIMQDLQMDNTPNTPGIP
jgi:hypothetical protein